MNLTKIGACLRDLRKEKGLTQEQLAERLNVSQRTVSRWETSAVMPDIDIMIELSDFYGVDLRSLLNGEREDNRISEEIKGTVCEAINYNKRYNGHGRVSSLISMILGLVCVGMVLFIRCAIIYVSYLAPATITTVGFFVEILYFIIVPVFSLAATTFGTIGLIRSHDNIDRYRTRSTIFSIVGCVGAVSFIIYGIVILFE